MENHINNAPSWGRLDNSPRATEPFLPTQTRSADTDILPYGNGRSYGDTCHNSEGTLLTSRHRNRIISFDRDAGILVAEAGILLSDLLQHLSNTRWFLPVVPGTKFVTLGGAIANDIHGKNHQHRGTFGCHVNSLSLWRPDGQTRFCNPTNNAKLFAATIAGMGLTGVIVSAEVQLMRVPSHFVEEEKRPFGGLDEYFSISQEAEAMSEYAVAWVDSLAGGQSFGRGILMTGKHVANPQSPQYREPVLKVPFTPPVPLVSGLPLRAFNFVYFHGNAAAQQSQVAHPNKFFFPLDAIGGWNKLYGPRGLYQHQSLLPEATARDALRELIRASQIAGHGSFLTVLKRFGSIKSPGLLSFPGPGYTLTLDFPNRGEKTRQLLNTLDEITLEAGGRTNPYKDARMSAQTFQAGFPHWETLEAYRDPSFNSDFWRRVTARRIVLPPSLASTTLEVPVNQPAKPQVQD